MTRVAELFYTRRSRAGRDAAVSGLDTAPPAYGNPSSHRHPHHHHRHGRHEDEAERARRGSLHARHLCHRVSQSTGFIERREYFPGKLNLDRELLRVENQFGNHNVRGSSSSAEASSSINNRQRATNQDDRLPGAVLLARARLLERLRGVSLTGYRGSSVASGISWDEFAASDDFRVLDGESGEWESENRMEWLEPGTPNDDLDFSVDSSPSFSLLDLSKKKPPGLSLEAISSLPRETFHAEKDDKPAEECCVCLERFQEGERLIFLLCGHRFHPICLNPWIRTCGDCPYCRTAIIVNHKASDVLLAH